MWLTEEIPYTLQVNTIGGFRIGGWFGWHGVG